MAWGDSLFEKVQRQEQERAEAAQKNAERHESFVRETVAEVGMNLTDLDDGALHEAILAGVSRIETGVAEHEWSRDFMDVLHGENELAGDDLLRIMINQNRVLIQQNELIARLLEKKQ